VIFAVARIRWRRALDDLRSRPDEGGAADFAYKAALLSGVFVADLVLVVALFSI
jgi:hypothetical protein